MLRRPEKRGLGDAYRAGFAVGIARDYDVIVQIDADLSHDPAVLPELIAALEDGADLAIGSRYVPGGSTPYWPWRRKALSRYGNLYAGFMLRTERATTTPRATARSRRDTLKAVEYQTTRAKGYGFQIELAYRVSRIGGTDRRGADHVHRPGARQLEDVARRDGRGDDPHQLVGDPRPGPRRARPPSLTADARV